MKKTDIAMIILIIAVSAAVAYGIVGAIPGLKLSNDPVKVKTIEKYSADITKPSPEIFNENAINPTIDINIGQQSN